MGHLSVSRIGPIFDRNTGIWDFIFYIFRFGMQVFLRSTIQYEKFYKFGISGTYFDIVQNFYVCNWCSIYVLCKTRV